jgi:SulP family sulfate permease
VAAVDWLRHYRRAWLRSDVVAALTTWALVVPQAIAYTQIAGLPPQAGLFAAFAGLLGYALFGTCRQLSVSPTSSTAAISTAIVAPLAVGDPARFADLSAALAMLVGAVLIGLGLLRMGFVSRSITAGAQVGFMFGLGLTIIVGQLPKLLASPPATATSSARPATC